LSPLSILPTSDGSHTIKDASTGDTYHSVHGAVQESKHVFIQNGLRYFLDLTKAKMISILEVGFGTGLNALLTMQVCDIADVQVDYVALEPFPLEDGLVRDLNYRTNDSRFISLHEGQWDKPVIIAPNFSLTKMKSTIQSCALQNSFDLVYYDAFAPTSQPDMWTPEVFKKIKSLMTAPSVFVTYCAKGQVKRDLKSAGFLVESIPGPPGKREMVRASLWRK
jgi:tRNA U34 5-methylaminomethyl-2-thiouridine-forming methyltransferase MnmC